MPDNLVDQFIPESSDVHIQPGAAPAASFVPSADDVIHCHLFNVDEVLDVQFAP
jgi:hypothetical protein